MTLPGEAIGPVYESYPKPSKRDVSAWPAAQIATILAGVRDGKTAAIIAADINREGGGPTRTRNAVIGKVFRLRREGIITAVCGRRNMEVEHAIMAVARVVKKRKRVRPPRPRPAPKPDPDLTLVSEEIVAAPLPYIYFRFPVKWHQPNGCAFLFGDPKDYDWCNRPNADGCDYCPVHKAIFYQKYQTPEQRAETARLSESIQSALKAKKINKSWSYRK